MSSQFLSSDQPCEPKSLNVAFNIAGILKKRNIAILTSKSWRPFDSTFEWKQDTRSVYSDGENLCPMWLVILKCILDGIRDTF